MRSRDRKHYEDHGNLFFITSTVVGFMNIFKQKEACEIFVNCLRFYQDRGDMKILAWVLMPNHFHLIIKVGDRSNISTLIGGIKRYSSRLLGKLLRQNNAKAILMKIKEAALLESGKGASIWKPRFDSLVIVSESILKQKIEYIHYNPVLKGFVEYPHQWYYSSATAYDNRPGIDLVTDAKWECLGYGA